MSCFFRPAFHRNCFSFFMNQLFKMFSDSNPIKGGREMGAGAFLQSLRRQRLDELAGQHSQLSEGVNLIDQQLRQRQEQQRRQQQQRQQQIDEQQRVRLQQEEQQRRQLEEQQRRQQQRQGGGAGGSGGQRQRQQQQQQQSSSSSSRYPLTHLF